MSTFKFSVLKQSTKSAARVGIIETAHGIIETPGFVPVATNASLKGVDTVTADDAGVQLMFCNTYHLMIQPGTSSIKKLGGLHKFMNRKGPLITDSGGFQIFSLDASSYDIDQNVELKGTGSKQRPSTLLKQTEEGVLFRSYRDGTKIFLSPETSVIAQKELGADIIIPLDQLLPYSVDRFHLKESLELTHRWEQRSLTQHLSDPSEQAMYCVLHGGLDRELRQHSIDFLSKLPFDGFAIGGSLGKTRDDLIKLLDFMMPKLEYSKPRHILGIGDMESISRAIPLGADTFDSCYPTRLGRHGQYLQGFGEPHASIKSAANKESLRPLVEECSCFTCRNYSKAYLNHLFKAQEPSFVTLLTLHNIAQMVVNMAEYRKLILRGDL